MSNKLIVFEGLDHSGKTTIINELASYLTNKGYDVYKTKQPGGDYGAHSQFIHDICKTNKYDLDPISNMFAFLLDRSENVSKEIIPKLEEGYVVLCDRWWYSTFAYQFYGKQLYKKNNITPREIIGFNFIASHFLVPNFAFFLDRENANDSLNDPNDIFETESDSFIERVKKGYEQFVGREDLRRIKVEESVEETLEKIIKEINL